MFLTGDDMAEIRGKNRGRSGGRLLDDRAHRDSVFWCFLTYSFQNSWKRKFPEAGHQWSGWFMTGVYVNGEWLRWALPVNPYWEICEAKVAEGRQDAFDPSTTQEIAQVLGGWLAAKRGRSDKW